MDGAVPDVNRAKELGKCDETSSWVAWGGTGMPKELMPSAADRVRDVFESSTLRLGASDEDVKCF